MYPSGYQLRLWLKTPSGSGYFRPPDNHHYTPGLASLHRQGITYRLVLNNSFHYATGPILKYLTFNTTHDKALILLHTDKDLTLLLVITFLLILLTCTTSYYHNNTTIQYNLNVFHPRHLNNHTRLYSFLRIKLIS